MASVEISTERARLDLAYIHRSLNATYWAAGRSLELIERTIANSLCFGAYDSGRQVGFARVVTDYAIFAYLMDVHVDPQRRGHGVGKALITAVLDHPELRDLNLFMLRTQDAQAFYRQFGFEEVSGLPATMARPRLAR